MLRRRPIGILRDRQQIRPYFLECLHPNAVDSDEVVNVEEGALIAAVGEDALGEDFADAGKLDNLGPVGAIDVDEEFCLQRRGSFDLDQSAPMPAEIPPVADRHHQGTAHQYPQAALVARIDPQARSFFGCGLLVGHGREDIDSGQL